MFFTFVIVTYAYIFFSKSSSAPYETPSTVLECSPTDIIKYPIASVLYLCPVIIHA